MLLDVRLLNAYCILQDERYSKYIGLNAIVPLTLGRHVPIISDKVIEHYIILLRQGVVLFLSLDDVGFFFIIIKRVDLNLNIFEDIELMSMRLKPKYTFSINPKQAMIPMYLLVFFFFHF